MDDSASAVSFVPATFDHRYPPESCEPLNQQSESAPHKAALGPAASSAHMEVMKPSRFIRAGEETADSTLEKKLHHRTSGAWSRKGRRGGGRGTVHYYASQMDREARASGVQHGQLSFIKFVGPQLIQHEVTPKMKLLTTGTDKLIKAPAAVASMLPQFSCLPLAWCDICRVDCNSVEVLERHKKGKRHKRTVQLLKQMTDRHEIMEEALDTTAHIDAEQNDKCIGMPNEGMNAKGAIKISSRTEVMDENSVASTSQKRKRAKQSQLEQPRVCILCSATCNSHAMFESHLAGKKHTSRIRRFQAPDAVYELLCDYVPINHQSTLAHQGSKPLYYGLTNSGHPLSDAVLNPLLEQEQKHEQQVILFKC